MNNHALLLKLSQIKPGAILARDVLDSNGRVLAIQGSEINDATLAGLSRRDITEVWALTPALQAPPEDDQVRNAELLQHHQQRLTRLFRHSSNGVDDMYLLNLMNRYRGIEPS